MEIIKERFEALSNADKRLCLTMLSDEYDVSVNYDLITAQKLQIKELKAQRATVADEYKKRIKELELEIGKLSAYIEELESQKPQKAEFSFDQMYCAIPKSERKQLRKQLAASWLYRNLINHNMSQREQIRHLEHTNEQLLTQLIKLRNQ